jgi:phosphopantetheinyl transferase
MRSRLAFSRRQKLARSQRFAFRDDVRTRAFFDCWTRKEAFIKALGTGLSYPLDRFTVSVRRDNGAELRTADGVNLLRAGWWMAHFEPMAGYTGAVVVEGRCTTVRYQWATPGASTELFELREPVVALEEETT